MTVGVVRTMHAKPVPGPMPPGVVAHAIALYRLLSVEEMSMVMFLLLLLPGTDEEDEEVPRSHSIATVPPNPVYDFSRCCCGATVVVVVVVVIVALEMVVVAVAEAPVVAGGADEAVPSSLTSVTGVPPRLLELCIAGRDDAESQLPIAKRHFAVTDDAVAHEVPAARAGSSTSEALIRSDTYALLLSSQ